MNNIKKYCLSEFFSICIRNFNPCISGWDCFYLKMIFLFSPWFVFSLLFLNCFPFSTENIIICFVQVFMSRTLGTILLLVIRFIKLFNCSLRIKSNDIITHVQKAIYFVCTNSSVPPIILSNINKCLIKHWKLIFFFLFFNFYLCNLYKIYLQWAQ